MRRQAALLVALGMIIVASAPVLAQYDPPAHMEIGQRPVQAEGAALLTAAEPLVLRAAGASGLTLNGAFRVDPDMQRLFALEWVDGREGQVVAEYLLSMPESVPDSQSVLDYRIEDKPIYIGFGSTAPDQYGLSEYRVFSFLDGEEGVTVLDSFALPAEYSSGIWALDLNNDDVLELACPWMTGAGGGGGIEVRAVVPTGGLAWFGASEEDSSIWSMHGTMGLLDYDRDGSLEIETLAPVLCTACGYYFRSLLTFDTMTFTWIDAEQRMPAYYQPQHTFYRKLAAEVRGLVEDPMRYLHSIEGLGPYSAQIDGQWVTLAPFIYEDGVIDQGWVDTLLEFAAR